MGSPLGLDNERRLTVWRVLVGLGSLALATASLAPLWLHMDRSAAAPPIAVQGSNLVSATLLRSDVVRYLRNGESEYSADFSLRNLSQAPIGLRVASKSCSCNHVIVGGRELGTNSIAIDPNGVVPLSVRVPLPSSIGIAEHRVVLASSTKPSHIPLRIQLRLLDDLELLPSVVDAKSAEYGFVAVRFEINARIKAGREGPTSDISIQLLDDKDAVLSVKEISRSLDVARFQTYRLSAVLRMRVSALTKKYNHFELVGRCDGASFCARIRLQWFMCRQTLKVKTLSRRPPTLRRTSTGPA